MASGGRSLDGIDPGEIASVTVLKDSLSAVRYGADAGQGSFWSN